MINHHRRSHRIIEPTKVINSNICSTSQRNPPAMNDTIEDSSATADSFFHIMARKQQQPVLPMPKSFVIDEFSSFDFENFGDFSEQEKRPKKPHNHHASTKNLIASLPYESHPLRTGEENNDGDEITRTRRKSEINGFSWENARKVSSDGWDDEATLAAACDVSHDEINAFHQSSHEIHSSDEVQMLKDQSQNARSCWKNTRSISFDDVEYNRAEVSLSGGRRLKRKNKHGKRRQSFGQRETPEEADERRRRMDQRRHALMGTVQKSRRARTGAS